MRIAIDFDGTLVEDDHAYDDLDSPLRLKPGARDALEKLKAAGHVIMLHSARANRALWEDWRLNPFWREGLVRFDELTWERNKELNLARYAQMVQFAVNELSGLIDIVDDGLQGKPMVDLFIDDRAVSYGTGAKHLGWAAIAERYGDRPEEGEDVG